MRQEQIDQLVRDIVWTLRNAGIPVARIIDWSKTLATVASRTLCGGKVSRHPSLPISPARGH